MIGQDAAGVELDRDGEADAIRLSPADNVATVLRPIGAGERVRVTCGPLTATVIAREPIPLCHKIGLDEISVGSAVIKYGDPIGEASTAIQAGSHVHVHNLRSARARPTGGEARSNVPGTA